MTNHIDHAAEARRLLGVAGLRPSANWEAETGERKADVLADAQTHATLALAEQQRIASVIALASLAAREDIQEELSEAAYGALNALITNLHIANWHPEGPDEVVVLRPDIAAALGIETGASDD